MQFGIVVPFTEHLGFELNRFDAGESEIVFQVRPEHMNSFGVSHGGASMTLLDVAMATAARSVQKDMGAVTIEMKTSFIRPAKGHLIATGHLLQRTKTLAFVEAKITDEHGRLCAHATGTFKYVLRTAAAPGDTPAAGGIATD